MDITELRAKLTTSSPELKPDVVTRRASPEYPKHPEQPMLLEVPEAVETTAGVRITNVRPKDQINYKSFEYRGFKINRSNWNGAWWVMTPRDEFGGWATNFEGGKNLIDYMIKKAADELHT